jgi:uncharacterized protein (TIGR02001 family)
MRKISTAAFAAFLLAGAAMPASAQQQDNNSLLPPGYGQLSATLGVTSDYRFRGISQTDENPALQGSLDWAHDSGVYLGTWASNVDLYDANAEIDLYGGYTFNHNGYDFDLGGIYYWYPGADDSLDYDFFEVKAAVGRDFGPVNAKAAINYSPDYFASSGDAIYTSVNATAPIMDTGFSVLGGAGYQWIDDETAFGAPDYADWSVGVGYTLYGFDLSLKYADTNISDSRCPDLCDATALFSVSRTFN